MSDTSHSKKTNVALAIFGSIAVVFVVFALGVYAGYRKAIFATGRSDNYYRDFLGGAPSDFAPANAPGMPLNTHGIVGTVIDVASTSIVVRDSDNDEESVQILPGTIIRMMDRTIDVDGIAVGDTVAVIGEPASDGQIGARFVRIFTASSSIPTPPDDVPFSSSSNGIIIHTL